MRFFHAIIHVRPDFVTVGPQQLVAHTSVAPLRNITASLPFPVTFEATLDKLQQLPRMFCEPDGSFVWVGEHDGTHWQLDGNLYDHAERLLFVDLQGTCSRPMWDLFLSQLGWPATVLMFQLPEHGIYLDETEFRRWAGCL